MHWSVFEAKSVSKNTLQNYGIANKYLFSVSSESPRQPGEERLKNFNVLHTTHNLEPCFTPPSNQWRVLMARK
jgi:hypothetical protein